MSVYAQLTTICFVILVYLSSVKGDSTELKECVENPSKPGCNDYPFDDKIIEDKLNSLCRQMPTMPGCTLRNYCTNENNRAEFCKPFSILGDLCFREGSMKMPDCNDYNVLCRSNTTTKQCKDIQPLQRIPSSKETKDKIKSICDSMEMDGCEKCRANSGNECVLLDVYSDLCVQMPEMPECTTYKEMCNEMNNGIGICKKLDSGSAPTMKMYFHGGIKDYILFKNWVPKTHAAYFGSFCAIVILGVLYELLLVVRSRLEQGWAPNSSDILCRYGFNQFRIDTFRGVFRFVEVGISYVLMLVAMTFNVGLFFAVLIGLGLGTFLFSRFAVYTTTLKAGCGC